MNQMHNQKRIPLLDLLVNCISATSEPKILSLKDKYTWSFLSFLIIEIFFS